MHVTAQQISQINVFSGLTLAVLAELASASNIQVYQRDEILIHEGEIFLPKFHAVLEGNLLVQKVSPAGKETTLRHLSTGEMFAAPALFGDGIAPATVKVLTDSKIITIEKDMLLKMIQVDPEVALQILHCFNQRLQEMHQTIHGLISERATIRLARLIQYMAERYGVDQTEKGSKLKMKLPHQQISRMIGITYEECVRMMKKDLADLVSYRRGGIITIHDASALKSLTVEL